ncbi:MAG: glucose-6-phosphate isomerase [Candidatus Omnitrophota bacterium]|jgi:glucose-6-phosphate isomerase
MKMLKFDFNNMLEHNIGPKHGVTQKELAAIAPKAAMACEQISRVTNNKADRINLGLEWTRLPFQNKEFVNEVQSIGDGIARKYESVISLGIGGSYLGLKAAGDALCHPYYNEFPALRRGRPRIYFDGNNLDPETLSVLIKNLDPKKTFVIVISKSGETTETKAAFTVVERWLKNNVGSKYGRQIFAITDPLSGTLRKKVEEKQLKDRLSFRNLPVMKGVGGRFSELNIGLLHMAIMGIKIGDVLSGAQAMAGRCRTNQVHRNPALMYAALNTILYRRKGKTISIMMPFSEMLKSTADWYVQLLAESLGKKYSRTGSIVNVGRTPISARGTNDLHSIQQNNIEGENNKSTTFIKIERFKNDIKLEGTGDFLSGKLYSELLSLAEEATEWALVKEERPSCTITMPEISSFNWGELIYFFEMATTFEGELLNLNAFDQPGVEGYKNYMYYKLRKPGLSEEIKKSIEKKPLVKKKRFII